MKKRIIYDDNRIISIEDIDINQVEIPHYISEGIYVVYDNPEKIKKMFKVRNGDKSMDHSAINEDGSVRKNFKNKEYDN